MAKHIGITLDKRKLKKLLTINLYSNKSTCIREIAANALDSKRRAKSTKPIYITYSTNTGVFSCKDYGMGMNIEDFEKKICVVGESDKEWNKQKHPDDDEIGKFGVGSLSWRSLTNRCKWICIKDGEKFEGEIWEEDEELDYEYTDEEQCNEENSVEVQLIVPYEDRYSFPNWLKEELAYFPDIFWNIDGDFSWNTLKIYEGEHFKISELSTKKQMHICLDDVVYNIDWNKLAISPIEANIGIKFKISDGIEPSITRETLSYNDGFKAILLDRIKGVAHIIINNYNQFFEKEHPIEDTFKGYKLEAVGAIHGIKFKMSEFTKYSSVKLKNFHIKGVNDDILRICINNKEWLLSQYVFEGKLQFNAFTTKGYIYILSEMLLNKYKVIALDKDDKMSRVKIEYIKTLYRGGEVYFVRKGGELRLWELRLWSKQSPRTIDNYYYILDLKKHPKSEWRTRIQQFQIVESRLKDKLIKWKDVIPSQEFLKSRKAKYESRAVNKQQGDITLKISKSLDRNTGNFDCKFEPTIVKIAELYKQKKLFIYATEARREELNQLFRTLLMAKYNTWSKRSSNIEICIIGEREHKHVKNNKHFFTIEQFMEGTNQPFRRFCTAELIRELIKKNEKVFKYRDFIAKINNTFSEKLKQLEEYTIKHSGFIHNDALIKNMLEIFEENKWYTEEYYLLKEVEKEINIYDFIPHLEKSVEKKKEGYSYSTEKIDCVPDEALDLAREILINRKRRYDIAKDVSKELLQEN